MQIAIGSACSQVLKTSTSHTPIRPSPLLQHHLQMSQNESVKHAPPQMIVTGTKELQALGDVSASKHFVRMVWTTATLILWAISVVVCFVIVLSPYSYNIQKTTISRIDPYHKAPWSDWSVVLGKYRATTSVQSVNATAQLLADSLRSMRCHGNSASSSVKLLSMGGVNMTSASSSGVVPLLTPVAANIDTVVNHFFSYTAPACACVHNMHAQFYAPAMNASAATSVTPPVPLVSANIAAFNEAYITGEPSQFFKPGSAVGLLPLCFFGQRLPHSLRLTGNSTSSSTGRHLLSVSPLLTTLWVNAIAAIFAGLYFVTSKGAAASTLGEDPTTKALASPTGQGHSVWPGVIAWLLLAGIVSSVFTSLNNSSTTVAQLSSITVLWLTVVIVMITVRVGTTTNGEPDAAAAAAGKQQSGAGKLVTSAKDILQRSVGIAVRMGRVQRLAFWVQHLLTLPVLVLLQDAAQQQRLVSYLISRVFTTVAVCLLAASLDCIQCTLVAEEEEGKAKGTRRNVRMQRAAWWCWGIWAAAVFSLLKLTSAPAVLGWSITDTLSGAETLIPGAVTVYAVGMVVVSMPGMGELVVRMNKLEECADAVVLSLRLGVDLVARMMLTGSVLYSFVV